MELNEAFEQWHRRYNYKPKFLYWGATLWMSVLGLWFATDYWHLESTSWVSISVTIYSMVAGVFGLFLLIMWNAIRSFRTSIQNEVGPVPDELLGIIADHPTLPLSEKQKIAGIVKMEGLITWEQLFLIRDEYVRRNGAGHLKLLSVVTQNLIHEEAK